MPSPADEPRLALRLLGSPGWRALAEAPGGALPSWHQLPRKDALLLARLALDGEQPRTLLAQWLWPAVAAPRAHANLRQRLYRLRHDVGPLVQEQGEGLQLAAGVLPDLWRDGCADDAAFESPLLDGLTDADDAAQQWLEDARQRWQARRPGEMSARAQRLEAAGATSDALALVQRLLLLEPLLEDAWRRLMRLHALRADRGAAIEAFERCERVLKDELGLRPCDETIALMRAIESGHFPGAAAPVSPRSVAVADTAPAPAYLRLPQRPALLIGRGAALEDLGRRIGLTSDARADEAAVPRAVTVVHGWPGVGKSTLLASLAYEPGIAARCPDGVLWVSLGETPDVVAELLQWLRTVDPAAAAGGPPTKEYLCSRLRARLSDRRVLLLVDDVWQPQDAEPFLVGGPGCAVVLSTRLLDTAAALAPAAHDLVRLKVLPTADGLELLRALTPRTVAAHPDLAEALVLDLEGLPLALHVAGRLLESEARMGWGVAELLSELRAGAALLQARAPYNMAGQGQGASPTVQALLARSTDGLAPDLRERFALMGLFVPKPATFSREAVAALWAEADPRPALRRLVDHGLLEPLDDGRFQMHALLVMHARSLVAG
jgi:DNA-binding SARP family transcriptional activator